MFPPCPCRCCRSYQSTRKATIKRFAKSKLNHPPFRQLPSPGMPLDRRRVPGLFHDFPLCPPTSPRHSMCRNIKTLFNFEPPVTDEEIRAAALQFARNAASLAFDGLLKPLTFLTNCSAAARISSSVTGGSKLNRVLMFLHISITSICQSRPNVFVERRAAL